MCHFAGHRKHLPAPKNVLICTLIVRDDSSLRTHATVNGESSPGKFVSTTSTAYVYWGKCHPTGSATNGELGSAPEGDTRCRAGLT
jgi:hypothetical protein